MIRSMLDMRMEQQGISAAEWIQNLPEKELGAVIKMVIAFTFEFYKESGG